MTIAQILAWADDFHDRTGFWPKVCSGKIAGALGETWLCVNVALTHGLRGLPGATSLARLLHEHRGVRNHMQLPPLTPAKILAWADTHHRRTGHWPNLESGFIQAAPGNTWTAVDNALRQGLRGLPGGATLAKLLARHRADRN